MYLLRVVVDEDDLPPAIVTVYRTSKIEKYWSSRMKLVYDPEVDVLSVLLSDAPVVAESDQDKPGVILDYDDGGNMVGFEILDASKRMANPMSVEYAVTPPLRRPA
jgi:uncharacterized protein YuzE